MFRPGTYHATCRHCQKVAESVCNSDVWSADEPFRRYIDISTTFTARDMLLGVEEENCAFCSWIKESAKLSAQAQERENRQQQQSKLRVSSWRRRINRDSENGNGKEEDSVLMLTYYSGTRNEGTFFWGRVGECPLGGPVAPFITTEGDPLAKFIPGRPVRVKPAGGALFAKIGEWLRRCDGEHGDRCRVKQRVLPSRVIHVRGGVDSDSSDAASLRLVPTSDMESTWSPSLPLKYAALSYCWGTDGVVKCLSSNLEEFQEGIPEVDLQPTIRDAVRVCRELKIAFLWVDALCIIQDDDEDKQKEMAKMTSIYSSAYVTISAARASSSSEGFLHPRDTPYEGKPPCFVLGCEATGRAVGTFGARIFAQTSKPEPTDTRGWVMQEKMLSRRIITFGRWTTTYKCCVEGKYDGWYPSNMQTGEEDATTTNGAFLSGESEVCSRSSKAHALKEWDALVDNFTRRNLSVPTDRVYAIAGIAEQFREKMKDDVYCAGIWMSSLPYSLLWCVTVGLPPRPKAYQGPTWSWMAVSNSTIMTNRAKAADDGTWVPPETIDMAEEEEEQEEEVVVEDDDGGEGAKNPHDAKLVKVSCPPAREDFPYGSVKQSETYLELDVHAFKTEIALLQRNIAEIKGRPELEKFHVNFDVDYPRTDKNQPADKLLLVAVQFRSAPRLGEPRVCGLLLRDSPETRRGREGVFERVGFFYFDVRDAESLLGFMQSQPRMPVTIV
ncbi:HET-domain-containing protein [Zalerion maritima]|uniref:HET-domain-containing protein n=1 Tax=Zalerion maritima TaxID=339359 RepID=A0AAD5RL51_9PEZI|nr:HET-domain-containing protein [Zalerion maritima]